jgi:uncharacterized protein YukE
MPISTSEMFEFLGQHPVWSIDRHEIASPSFGLLRRSLRQVILGLRDSDDLLALNILDALRPLLSEWLTAPVPFDRAILQAMADVFGEPTAVQSRWGRDIRLAYEAAIGAAESLTATESPLRQALRTLIQELSSETRAFKIYCHRRARSHFDSLFPISDQAPATTLNYIHSLPEYRESELFDVLIKVGPLRARGWGATPDALVTAPRFQKITQVVWTGSLDDPDFGYSPVSPPRESSESIGPALASANGENISLKWATHVTRVGEDPYLESNARDDIDDLRSLQDLYRHRDKRSASLVQIDEKHGILYPPHSQVLCFDPNQTIKEPIDYRIAGETLHERMFLIRPHLAEVDLGTVSAQHGSYSQIWRRRLTQEFRANAEGLIRQLRAAGLNLVHLQSAIEHWCESPSSVIHAPQQMRHFEILISVLALEEQGDGNNGQTLAPWWQRAWMEIRRSRGEAIQSGFIGKEIIDEQLLIILQGILPQIREKAAENTNFQVEIPTRSDVRGSVEFYPVVGIEHGFHVPDTELKVIHELKAADKWRD